MSPLEAARAKVDHLVLELHTAAGLLAGLATAAGDEKLAADATALQESLVQQAAPADEPSENPFMASHRAFVTRIRARRLPRASSVP